jgi:hypothetical protein
MGGVQQLRGFEDHLHDVFVAVKASRSARAAREDEDIHLGSVGSLWPEQIRFQTL